MLKHADITIVGLGNSQPVDIDRMGTATIEQGPHKGTYHNLGLETLLKLQSLLKLNPLRIVAKTFRTRQTEDYAAQSWVACSITTVKVGAKNLVIRMVYPGPNIGTLPAGLVKDWLFRQGFHPSRTIFVVADPSQPELTHAVSAGMCIGYRSIEQIMKDFFGVIPIMRIGTGGRTPEETNLDIYDASDLAAERAARNLYDRIHQFSTNERISFADLPMPKPRQLQKGARKTLQEWTRFISTDIQGLTRLSATTSGPVLGIPVYLPDQYIESNIKRIATKCTRLAELLLIQYKKGDPAVRRLLESTIGPLDHTLKAYYRFLPEPLHAADISLGVDTCWDFIIDPKNGSAYLVEGDRNGGMRGDALAQTRFHLNRQEKELGDSVHAAKVKRMETVVAREYARYCALLGKKPKARPVLAMVHAERKLFGELLSGTERPPSGSMQPAPLLQGYCETHVVTEKSLRLEKDKLMAVTSAGEVEVDMLWHLCSPALLQQEDFYPIINAMLAGRIKVLFIGDPAKDLVFLNKPLLAVLATGLYTDCGVGEGGDPLTLASLFGSRIGAALPGFLDNELKRRVQRLYDAKILKSAIAKGTFGDKTGLIRNALENKMAHGAIIRLIKELATALPHQIMLTQNTPVYVTDWIIGRRYIKADSLRSIGGRAVAAPSDMERARRLLREVQAGVTNGVAQEPLHALLHPVTGNSIEVRWWGYVDTTSHPIKEIEKHSRETLWVRVASGTKVDLKLGTTVVLRY